MKFARSARFAFVLFVAGLVAYIACAVVAQPSGAAESKSPNNLALVATSSTSYVSGHETIRALNDGNSPRNSNDKRRGAYGNWPQSGLQWVEYDWPQPINTNRIEVYWFDDRGGVRVPKAARLKYYNGADFVEVEKASGLGLAPNQFNVMTFAEVKTAKLRLEMESTGSSTGILEWRVLDSGNSPNFAPSVEAGVDRLVVLSGKTYLRGTVKDDGKPSGSPTVSWSKESGPGEVTFEKADAAVTTAKFSAAGDYVLRLTASDGQLSGSDTLRVTAELPPPARHLEPVTTKTYQITSPLWRAQAKKIMVNWIPHCYTKISDPKVREGGIDNFVQAGNKLAGRPFTRHVGAVFANAWVHNTVESMCVALMVDPQGDQEIIDAQEAMRAVLDDWIPKILSAQEPDGYLQTCYTLGGQPRWTNKADHEGYLAGYFIESAIAHYLMTNKADDRMYKAARKLADCWCDNIGPAPKRAWYEGHQELEQALVRLSQFVDGQEGPGKGRKYLDLAKFLMDSRRNGQEYDQSHLPVVEQYEAVGHAVRAVYSYSGMAGIAMETGDVDYQSAVRSIWSNIVNKKYYVTGGVGSGETSEGFGKDYSLPNNAYCESCSGCGELFLQHKLNLTYHDAKYADLYEETLYNAILGDLDLEGKNFTYTNALDSRGGRYPWHVCPCCVGNIPRTLLMLPTWMYATGEDGLYVNLFIGSKVDVEDVAGTRVQMVQQTDYPYSDKVAITVNPAAPKEFTLRIRVPNRQPSGLYTSTPAVHGITSILINGAPATPTIERGYAVISRTWKAGDRIELVLPLAVQRVKADEKVAADVGRVALRYGPLVYNIESVDQDVEQVLDPSSAFSTEWKGDLLGGVMVVKGKFANGAALTAVPNYARSNRGGRSLVWIKDR
ncbi:MAG: glycoside hydrolase family 127 protein [Pirellulales bacterium]